MGDREEAKLEQLFEAIQIKTQIAHSLATEDPFICFQFLQLLPLKHPGCKYASKRRRLVSDYCVVDVTSVKPFHQFTVYHKCLHEL